MGTCCECGASLAPDENFCGSCGARRQRDDTSLVSKSGSVGNESSVDNSPGIVSNYSHKLAEDGSTWMEDQPKTAPPPADGNRHTGEIVESAEFSSKTSRAGAVPDK